MTHATPEKSAYFFEEIDNFDARRGYKRCKLPGVGYSPDGGPRVDADLWRDRANDVVVRFSCQGDQYSFTVQQASGQSLRDDQLNALGDYLAELLFQWTIEGVDESPIDVIPLSALERRDAQGRDGNAAR